MPFHLSLRRVNLGLFMAASALSFSPVVQAQSVPIVLPGAPGEDSTVIDAEDALEISDNSYSADDVRFLTNMIPHHNQAVLMANLVEDRTNTPEVIEISGRINAGQDDEIAFMQDWLSQRGEKVPDPSAHAHMDMSHEMAGMASPEQMEALAAAEGAEFDQLFLTLMIAHHKGAITMVDALFDQPGSAYDPVLYDFANDVENDQSSEIERMNKLLNSLSPDPRANLKAGFRDAGEAISNLALLASLPKPAGFFDPKNPMGLPPIIEKEPAEEAEVEMTETASMDGETMVHEGHEDGAHEGEGMPTAPIETASETIAAQRSEVEEDEEDTQWGLRSPLLSFSNTDMAFAEDTLFVGNYHGFNIYKLSTDGLPELFSSIVCPGGQGDVSVVGNLLIMSVEQTRGRVDCGLQGVAEEVSAERFRGLRIFDISDMAAPRQVGQVQTCRGSHTHSIVSGPDEDGKLIVYNSGTSSVRDTEELAGCIGRVSGEQRTALFRIDVIEIPMNDPASSRIIDSAAVFADEETGNLAGLWQGGDHGEDTQSTRITDHCHDITVFPEANIAAGACSGNGVIFDITDPRKPKRLDAVTDPGFAYWHSATFNNDGTKVIFTDEWGGGGRPRCRAYDPVNWGANAIYDIVDGKLKFRAHYKMPAPQLEEENCVAHNGSVVPVPGRDIFVQAWYQGGLSLMDYTDSDNPVEIAYFDRGPLHGDRLVVGGYWSTYWYNGKIYGTGIVRGLDVLSLIPSDYLTEHEIAAAELANQGDIFNPQQQFTVNWPAEPVVAHAYIDQLNRDDVLSRRLKKDLNRLLTRAESLLAEGETDSALARQLESLASEFTDEAGNSKIAERQRALGGTLSGLATRLR